MSLHESEEFSRKATLLLREIRVKKGISQKKLAEMAGISRAGIQHIEKGIRNPTLMVYHAICTALEVSVSDILKRAETE